MPAWLSNPWVIGIGGGLLSGTIVTGAARFLFSKRENREYLQKVESSNREVIYAMRPGISEGVMPSPEVVESLITATARRYCVDNKDVFGPEEIAQELIKEIMDSSFISAKDKEDYCNSLGNLTKKSAEAAKVRLGKEEGIPVTLKDTPLAEYRARLTNYMSLMIGSLAALMTVFVAFMQFSKKGVITDGSAKTFLEQSAIILPTVISLAAVISVLVITLMIRETRRRRQSTPKMPDIRNLRILSREEHEKAKTNDET